MTHQLVYSNESPGASTGCAPTTPSPRTSCTSPIASVMIQCRVFSCAVCPPWFVMRTVYANAYRRDAGTDRSGMYSVLTVTRIPLVKARDMSLGYAHGQRAHQEEVRTVRRGRASSGRRAGGGAAGAGLGL